MSAYVHRLSEPTPPDTPGAQFAQPALEAGVQFAAYLSLAGLPLADDKIECRCSLACHEIFALCRYCSCRDPRGPMHGRWAAICLSEREHYLS
jgi:hypothetical protein